ncbi:uncharacterized protein LOC117337902 [Pecten maximus]|uniref:uncharacterized protein LOC117337902 n=1 Tax=Pecten maximus TaxID=6579 RepID=UPI0014583A51|nr:uncharacterized protein LOC117337902 [Pecten maximus]
MSPLVLLLAVIAGSISASTIRDYIDGNNIEDVFDHQENAGPGSEEITNLPADNIDSEMVTDTDIGTDQANMQCNEFYICMFANPPPQPLGSFTEGFTFSSGYLRETCRHLESSIACYYQGDYAACPTLMESVRTMTNMYDYICDAPGRSAVLSIFQCINNFELQLPLMMMSFGLSHSIRTIMDWPDQEPTNIALMMCRVAQSFYQESGAEIERQCSEVDRGTFEHIFVIWSQSPLQRFNCTIGENNNTSL